MSLIIETNSFNIEAISCNKRAMSCDKGAKLCDKGAKLCDKGAKSVIKVQKLTDFDVFKNLGFLKIFVKYSPKWTIIS